MEEIDSPAKPSPVASGAGQRRTTVDTTNNKLFLALLGLLGLAWMAGWTYLFFVSWAGEIEYDRKMAMIERGEVKPHAFYVDAIYHELRPHRGWQVYLRTDQKDLMVGRWDANVDNLHVGSRVMAYRFDDVDSPDGYLIPRFDHGPNKGVAVVIGLLPIVVAGGIFLYKKCRLAPAQRHFGTKPE
jgi:hypothetical protein